MVISMNLLNVQTISSEASGEGVEGEPVATPGGGEGSPRTGLWCSRCGDAALNLSWNEMVCQFCFRTSIETTIQITAEDFRALAEDVGLTTQQIYRSTQQIQQTLMSAAASMFSTTPGSPQSPGPATPLEVLTLEHLESALKQLEDSTSGKGLPAPGSTPRG